MKRSNLALHVGSVRLRAHGDRQMLGLWRGGGEARAVDGQ